MRGMRNTRFGGLGIGLRSVRLAAWNPGLVTDPDVHALYRFHADDPMKDLRNGEDLEYYERVQLGEVWQEGAGCAQMGSAAESRLQIADAALSAGFPLKQSVGGPFTIAFWKRYGNSGGCAHVSKYGSAVGTYSFGIFSDNGAPERLRLRFGWDTGQQYDETASLAHDMIVDRWYLIVASVDGAGNYLLWVWDPTLGTSDSIAGAAPHGYPYLCTVPWTVNGVEMAGYQVVNGSYDWLSVWDIAFDVADCEDLRDAVIDPDTDATCVSVWHFDFDSMYDDYRGNNDFPVPVPVTSTDRKEGQTSLHLEWTQDVTRQSAARSNAALHANNPFKNGNEGDDFSVTQWLKFEAISGTPLYCWSSGWIDNATGHGLCLTNVQLTGKIQTDAGPLTIGWLFGAGTGVWYLVGVTWNATTHEMRLWVWNDTTKVVAFNSTSSLGTTRVLGTAPWRLGAWGVASDAGRTMDGLVDETAIWKRTLSVADLAKLAEGKYKY